MKYINIPECDDKEYISLDYCHESIIYFST